MSRRIILALIFMFFMAINAFPIDKQNANWLLYEQGCALIDQKEYGQALKLFQEAVTSAGIFPEAELAIGDVYLEEGEVELAIFQYEKAYNLRKSFYIPDMQYTALYKLADVYQKTEKYNMMEEALSRIIQDDNHYAETPTYKLRTQIERVYLEKGLDRVFLLYAFPEFFSAAAHSRLGWFYYRTGRYEPSISHLLFSLIYRASQIKSFIKEKDADFTFSTLPDLLLKIEDSPDLRKYSEETGFFADLYYLAGSTYANGLPLNAKAIWRMISKCTSAGKYKDLSTRQVKKPALEPLIKLDYKLPQE